MSKNTSLNRMTRAQLIAKVKAQAIELAEQDLAIKSHALKEKELDASRERVAHLESHSQNQFFQILNLQGKNQEQASEMQLLADTIKDLRQQIDRLNQEAKEYRAVIAKSERAFIRLGRLMGRMADLAEYERRQQVNERPDALYMPSVPPVDYRNNL